MRVVFFGTPQFAASTLQGLLKNGVEVTAVVTKPDRPKGRSGAPVPTPVKEVALANNIPVHQPLRCSHPDFTPILAHYQADLFVVVAYGEILKEHLLQMPPLGCINVHASLLPHYRGAAPIQRCLMAGERESGVSIMYMVREMDAGDVIQMVKTPIAEQMTAGELEQTLCSLGTQALLDTLNQLQKGLALPGTPQRHSEATFAPKVELEDCRIHWSEPALSIHNLVRASHPEPGAWCLARLHTGEKRLKIWRTRPIAIPKSVPPGALLLESKKVPIIGCGKDALELLDVQLEGKKMMQGVDFFRGLPLTHLF